MLRKVRNNIVAWLVVFMTVLGTLGISTISAKAADDTCSVNFTEIAYDLDSSVYTVSDPVVTLPAGKSATYITINVTNGSFNTAAISSSSVGTHTYNYGGSQYSAFSDLLILKSPNNTADAIETILKSIKFTYNANINSDADNPGIGIYFTLSTNEVKLPSGSSYYFYQVPGENHYYMYVDAETTWHEAYNAAKSLTFGGLKGYLATITSYDENKIMANINRSYAWIGGTAIYVAPTGVSTGSKLSSWLMIDDFDSVPNSAASIANMLTTAKYASAHGMTESQYGGLTSSTIYTDYYWADGPEHGNVIDSSLWASGEPNSSGELYDSTLIRAENDYTRTEDCALTNWDGGLLNDYAETQEIGYFVEFSADESYANGFADNYDTWKKGNSNTYLIATKNVLGLETKDNSIEINKYLIMDDSASVPNTTFSFSIKAGTGTTNGTGVVYAGNAPLRVSGTPTIGTAKFTTASVTSKNDTTYNTVNLEDGQKYATAKVKVDFSSVDFSEPGVYRYLVSEVNPNKAYITADTRQLILDVYVSSNDTNDKLEVTNYVLHTDPTDTVYGTGAFTSASKVDGFVNTYKTNTLTIVKSISGNQARTDEYFDFNISISNAVAGTIYKVSPVSESYVTPTGKQNTTSMVAGTNGTASGKVWMKAGDSFIIEGLANGTAYTVGENTETLNSTGYESTLASAVGDNQNGAAALAMDATTKLVADSGLTANTVLTINNEKKGIVPTGVIIAVAPYAAIGLCGFFGLIVFARHKKSKEDDDE
ncbi:MAG: hypothetical protein LKF53_05255 [Solobacterium sp.]|jgi:pilin isopeptide linkage protein|nr:hypothetical protein [Solobacterium sp.]MCH4205781.1 hypothetical protein [Solobacterium sp.]MCH4227305.1 hypothetical protein [Solobacterium sp.]